MPFVIVALALFATPMAADADAATDAELLALAKKFSPVLILTEETQSDYGEDTDRGILVLKPEPVGIMWLALGLSWTQNTAYEYREEELREVSDYLQVQQQPHGGSESDWGTVSGGGPATTTVTGLTPGVGYTFQVQAENGVGLGPATSVVDTATGTPLAPATLPPFPVAGR